MQKCYDIYDGSKKIGTVTAEKEGLYYRFSCSCQLHDREIHRLCVRCGAAQQSLGVLTPGDGGFALTKRISIKSLGEGEMSFYLEGKAPEEPEIFVPVYPDEPFAYIARLQDGYLARRNGQRGIVIKDRSPDTPGSGQNPGSPGKWQQP